MPFYVSDEIIDQRMCAPVAQALKAIKYEMQAHAVTPSLALSLIKSHFLPILPVEYHATLKSLKQASWEKLSWKYPDLVSNSSLDSSVKTLLTDIGVSIDWICRYTTLPPREPTAFDNLETNIFLQHCGFIGIKIAHLRYLDTGQFDVLKACKYCWRQPVPGRDICVVHTASNKHMAMDFNENSIPNAGSGFTSYKEGRRQKREYEKTINQMLTRETLTFHDTSFADPIFLPDNNIWPWLIERRPLVAKLLIDTNQPIADHLIIDSLLLLLHSPSNLTETLLQPYLKANRHIKAHPKLIWLMLLRAEAWFNARNRLRANWGGKRRVPELTK